MAEKIEVFVSPESPLLIPHRRRNPWVLRVFVGWVVLAVVTLVWMGRLPCGLSRDVLRVRAWAAPGWRAEHTLAAATPVEDVVVAHLVARGPLTGLAEAVLLSGAASRYAPELEARGWNVVVGGGPDDVNPRVRLFGPRGVVAWTARHDVSGLLSPSAAPLDTAAFRAVLAGDFLPPVVPAGCGI